MHACVYMRVYVCVSLYVCVSCIVTFRVQVDLRMAAKDQMNKAHSPVVNEVDQLRPVSDDDEIKNVPNDKLKDKDTVNKLFKVLKCTIPESNTSLNCDDCNEETAVAFCINCVLCLCDTCYGYHKKKKKQHSTVSLTEKSFVRFCPAHPEERECKYYCETCDQFACLYCITTNHKDHTHDTTEKMAYNHRMTLIKMIAPAEEMSENLSKAEANIVSAKKKIEEQASEIDQEIDKCHSKQLLELHKHCQDLKRELHKAVLQKQEALDKQVRDLTSLQDEKVKPLKEMSETLKVTLAHEIFSTKKQYVESRMQKVSEQYKNLNTEPVEYNNLEFVPAESYSFLLGHLFTFANPHTSEFINLSVDSGIAYCGRKVEFKIIAKDSKGKNCTKGGSQVCAQLKSFTGDVAAVGVKDNNDGSYMASFVAKQVGEAKLSVTINGQQIKGSPYSIVVGRNYQAIDKPNKIVNYDGSMGQPYDVAFSSNGLWAVADYSNHRVLIFDDKDQYVKQFGGNGNSNGQFSSPCGVAFDSHNHLYVVDRGNNRVQKFDTLGYYLLQFGNNNGRVSSPEGIAIHKDKVYIADYGNKRVSVFQTNGEFYIAFGSHVLGNPKDVAVSADKYLVVAGYATHCIYTFTLDGHYIGKFGTKGSYMREFNGPCGIISDVNGFIMVADTSNHCVSIFDNNGKHIHCFGTKGSADGQFSNPRGIAIGPNGSIYVSDSSNKRIQIFSNYRSYY